VDEPGPTAPTSGAVPDLANSARLGRVAFERSSLPMLFLDDKFRIRCENPAACAMFEVASLRGRSIAEFLEQGTDGIRRRELLPNKPTPGEWEVGLSTANGRNLYLQVHVDPAVEISGEELFLLQFRDLTELREHEKALSESEQRYRQVVANLPDMSVLSFDRDLRIQIAMGEVLNRSGYDADAMQGQLMTDVLPRKLMERLEVPYRAALHGLHSDFDYLSPITGRQFRMRIRPVYGADGEVLGGLGLAEDVSVERTRQAQLEHLQRRGNVGGGWYTAGSGWGFDRELLHLLGVDSGEEAIVAMRENVLPEDAVRSRPQYLEVLASGGQCTVQYRIRHGRSGEIRHALGTCEATVDGDGTLLQAIITHTDITDSVLARVSAEEARASAADARTLLLRRVSDLLATDPRSLGELMHSITDIAATETGEGAVLRVLTPDRKGVELDLVSHTDATAKERIQQFLRANSIDFDPRSGLHGAVFARGQLLSSIGDPDWRIELGKQIGPESIRSDVAHFIFAPVRHEGSILGFLHVFRSDPNRPYIAGDDDLVQVLADRVGAAIAEDRVRRAMERQRVEGREIAERLAELTIEQRELMDQLADVEERERTLLAEAIHDDPMQLIVASIMRMDMLQGALPAAQAGELDRLAATLQESVEKLRTLIVALTPPDLTDGLGVALRNLAEGIFIGTKSTIRFIGASHVMLSVPTKVTAYRILREALVNARKHSRAKNITVSVGEQGESVVLQLADDGVGAAELDAGPGHLGVATMYARATSEGGRLDIDSSPGIGTTVVLTLPKQITR